MKNLLYGVSTQEILNSYDKFKITSTVLNKHTLLESNSKLLMSENGIALKYLQNAYTASIDLVYIDPPFASNNIFTVSDERSNTVSRTKSGKVAYSDVFLLEDYLEFIKTRLVLIRELMSEQGSIYLHIDYKVGHYVKIIMDEVFGLKNFRNDITRVKCNPKNFSRRAYGNVKDVILFYTKSNNYIWNDVTSEMTASSIDNYKKMDINGRRYTTIPLHAPGETVDGETGKAWKGVFPPVGRHWRTNLTTLDKWDQEGLIEWSKNNNPRKKVYLDERNGSKIQDIWEFKDNPYPSYPTEKNLNMLKQIILNSSSESSIVLDCFCGSGSTLLAADQCNREWIGIDNSEEAINTTKVRLSEINATYEECKISAK